MRRILLLAMLLPLLSACGPGSDNAEHAQTAAVVPAATPAATAPAAAPAKPAGPIWFDPSERSSCGRPSVVTVHWDVRNVPDVKEVNVMTIRKDGTEALFFAGGRKGAKESGPWMRAGSEMVLRARTGGAELGRVKLGSLPCTK